MNSQLKSVSRRITLLPGLLLLLLSTSSCSHRTVPRPVKQTASPPHTVVPAVQPKIFQPIAFPALNTDEVSNLAFSPDGRSLAFGYGNDAETSLWNLETGKLRWQRYVNATSSSRIQFGPDGRFLIAQFSDPDSDTPIIICTVGGRRIMELAYFEQRAGRTYLEKAGRFLVTEGREVGTGNEYADRSTTKLAEVWDTRTWHRRDHIVTAMDGFIPLTSSGKIIHHPHPEKTPRLLNAEGEPAGTWWKHVPFPSLGSEYNIYTDTAKEIFARATENGSDTGQVDVWDLYRQKLLWTKAFKNECPRVLAISPTRKILVVATLQGYIYFWNLKTGHLISKTLCSTDVLRCLAFSPNGLVLAASGGYEDGNSGIRLVDMKSYKVFAVLKAAFPKNNDSIQKDWTLNHPDWFASLPDLSYVASDSVIKKIRTPGRVRDSKIIRQFNQPQQVRAALRKCFQ